MGIKRYITICALAGLPGLMHAQEICNNGIDDDSDGLLDLNDTTDCVCSAIIGGGGQVTSLLPNPSFEDYDCVPTSFSQLNCASIWEQATAATSDYFLNVQGGLFPTDVIPQPIPDGLGCAGFIITPGYEEYIGGCLEEPMLAGESQTLQMGAAGGSWDGFAGIGVFYGPVELTIFGYPTCPTFPVGSDNGCPVPAGWIVLGSTLFTADNTWQQIQIDFVPPVDINAVMIGGPCNVPLDVVQTNGYYPYFWVDDMTINQSSLFSSVDISGSTCTDNIVLTGHPDSLATSYQWYQEGVAIIGQTDSVLNVSALDLPLGNYQFLASVNDTACVIAAVVVVPPVPAAPLVQAVPSTGCPPLVVDFTDATSGTVTNCRWLFGDGTGSADCDPTHIYTQPGTYDVTLTVTMANGCTYDSTYVALITVVPPPTAAFTSAPQPVTTGNTEVTLTDASSQDVISWTWNFDTIPPFQSGQANPVVTFPMQPGYYPVMLVVTNAAGCTDTAFVLIRVVANGDLDMPNVFSPNGDQSNDNFVPLDEFPGKGRLSIFNRWGQEVFATSTVTAGWNGSIKGSPAPDGTYFWVVENLGDNTDTPFRTGHVTLLR